MKKIIFLAAILFSTASFARQIDLCFKFEVKKAGQVTNQAICNVQQDFLSSNSSFWRCSFDGKINAMVTSAIETGYDEMNRQPYVLYEIRPSARVGVGKFIFEGLNFPKSDVTVPMKVWLVGFPQVELKKFESDRGVMSQTLELTHARFGYCSLK